MSVRAGQSAAVSAGLAAPSRPASQSPAVFLTLHMDRAERRCRDCGEHARVSGNGAGDSLAAAETSADELVGVSAVDLRARRAAGGAAGLAGDRQDAAGLVDGGVAVEQFAGGPVDVINAATQQNRLQASPGVPDRACGDGVGGQRRYSSRRALAGGVDERRRTCRQAHESLGLVISGAVPHVAWLVVACRSGVSTCGFGTVTGHLVTHRPGVSTVIPHCGGWVLVRLYPYLKSLNRTKSISLILWRGPAARPAPAARPTAGLAW
jgi:hypothetical protein